MDDIADVGARCAELVESAERRLRRSLVAALGHDAGPAATGIAVAYGWEHRERLDTFDGPVGHLYRVGRSRTAPRGRGPAFRPVPDELTDEIEPHLPVALGTLPERQRAALTMVEAAGWTVDEAAEALDITVRTLRLEVADGLERLRTELGLTSAADLDVPRQLVAYLDATTEAVAPPAVEMEREASVPGIVLLGADENDDEVEPTTTSPRGWLLVGAVVAAVVVVVGVFVADDGSERDRETADGPSTVVAMVRTWPADGRVGQDQDGGVPEEVAALGAVGDRFTAALGTGEAGSALRLMSADATVDGLFGADDRGDVADLFGWFDATDFRLEVDGCRAYEPDQVRCAARQSSGWSDAVDATPVRGLVLMTVEQSRITALSYIYDRNAWGPLVQDPFVEYVRENHPASAVPLWDRDGRPRLTDRTLALFERYSAEYAAALANPSPG